MLNILGRRPDGFHDLETLFQHVPVCDQLEIEKGAGVFRFTCSTDCVPTGLENLVYRAAVQFFEKAGISPQGHIHLRKNLPSEAGLGGGSANAGITLRALNKEYDYPLKQSELYAIASGLGSDVPFFLLDGPAIGYGRGEQLQELLPFESLRGVRILLIKPAFGVSTGWAYKTLAQYPEHQKGRLGRVKEFVTQLQTKTLQDVAPFFYNSLEAPVLAAYPIMREYQIFLRDNGADVTLMSGSGSTTFALVQDPKVAEALPELFKSRFGADVWIAIAQL